MNIVLVLFICKFDNYIYWIMGELIELFYMVDWKDKVFLESDK